MEEELPSWKGFLEGRQAIQEEYIYIYFPFFWASSVSSNQSDVEVLNEPYSIHSEKSYAHNGSYGWFGWHVQVWVLREVLNPSEVQAILGCTAFKIWSMVQVERGCNGTIILSKESVQSPTYIRDVGASHASTNLEPLIQSWLWCLLTISAFQDPRMGIVTWQKIYAVTTFRWRWCECFWQWEVYRNQVTVSDVLTVHAAEFVCVSHILLSVLGVLGGCIPVHS